MMVMAMVIIMDYVDVDVDKHSLSYVVESEWHMDELSRNVFHDSNLQHLEDLEEFVFHEHFKTWRTDWQLGWVTI